MQSLTCAETGDYSLLTFIRIKDQSHLCPLRCLACLAYLALLAGRALERGKDGSGDARLDWLVI